MEYEMVLDYCGDYIHPDIQDYGVIFPWSGVGYFQSKLHMFEFENFHEDNRVSAMYILLEITEEIFTQIKNGLNLSNTGYIQANDANFLAEAHFTQTSEGFLVSWVRVG